ncbi:hypothetical protein GCM10022394_03410 [Zobellella aerophila]|uniref:Uncharacterized protein n=1 Tax=Zobellella aerophila TaxID=870480 RepID=A0ABP6V2F2_9GAMM
MSAPPTIRAKDGAAEPPGRGLRRVGGAVPFARFIAVIYVNKNLCSKDRV